MFFTDENFLELNKSLDLESEKYSYQI